MNYSQHPNINIYRFTGNSKAYHMLSGLIKQSMLKNISSPSQLGTTTVNINHDLGVKTMALSCQDRETYCL